MLRLSVLILISFTLILCGCSSDKGKVESFSLFDMLLAQIIYVHDFAEDIEKKEEIIEHLVHLTYSYPEKHMERG